MSTTEEFTEFAVGAAPRLRRTAFLLCGDWHTAEDLVQTTLARTFVSWRRITRRDAVYAYASRTLVNTFLADRRRRRGRELLTGWLPERPDPAAPAAPEARMVVLDALATLPPKMRVVVVMRYWSDLSVEQVADLLGCSAGNVKSQSARGLDKLRAVLGSSLLDQPRERGTPGMDEAFVDEVFADEPALRALLERAVASDPPIGPVAYQALEAGSRRRRRRRVGGTIACLAVAGAVAAAGITLPTVRSASVAPATGGPVTIYAASKDQITPVWTATGTAGASISDNVQGPDLPVLAATPDGKTVYVADEGNDWVTPVSTATNTAAPRITTGANPYAIAITPDGSTAYVANVGAGTVTPITAATGVPGRPIKTGGQPVAIAITPDGRTAYVLSDPPGEPSTVTPVSTATDVPGRPIKVAPMSLRIAITPDGRTAYVMGYQTVTPISVGTGVAGRPIKTAAAVTGMVFTPDSKTAWAIDSAAGTVIPIAVATSTAGRPIKVGGYPVGVVISPDGRTVYVAQDYSGPSGTVTPISTATGVAGRPIKLAGDPSAIGIVPGGTIAYVACLGTPGDPGSAVPISTATGTAGKPIKIQVGPLAMVIVAERGGRRETVRYG